MGIDINAWRGRIGCFTQPIKVKVHLQTLKLNHVMLCIRIVLFALLTAQCVEKNPGPTTSNQQRGRLSTNTTNRGAASSRSLRSQSTAIPPTSPQDYQLPRPQNRTTSPPPHASYTYSQQRPLDNWLTHTQSVEPRQSFDNTSITTGTPTHYQNPMMEVMLDVQRSVRRMESKMDTFEISLNEVKASNKILETNQKDMQKDFKGMTEKVDRLEEKLKASENKCEQLESQSRRDNLRLFGIRESENETWEETESRVREFIKRDLELEENEIKIERAHRLPGKESPRPVIVKFSFFKDRDNVLQTYKGKRKEINEQAKRWQEERASTNNVDQDGDRTVFEPASTLNKDISMAEDFPARVAKARNDLRPFLKKELYNGNRAYLRYDKLVIAGISYEFDPVLKDIVQVGS